MGWVPPPLFARWLGAEMTHQSVMDRPMVTTTGGVKFPELWIAAALQLVSPEHFEICSQRLLTRTNNRNDLDFKDPAEPKHLSSLAVMVT